MPRHLRSVFNLALDRRAAFRGPLDDAVGNRNLLETLGGAPPEEVVVVPLLVDGLVVAVLYADAGADGGSLGNTSTLEGVVAEIGRTLSAERA